MEKEVIVECFLKVRYTVVGVLLVLGVIGALVLVWINVRRASLPESSFFRHFILTDETFNHRGFIWKGTVKSLKEEPIWRIFLEMGKTVIRIL